MMNDAVESDDQTAPPNNWVLSPLNQCYLIQRCAIVGRMKIAVLATVSFVRRPMFGELETRWLPYDLLPVEIHRTMWSVPKKRVFVVVCSCNLCGGCGIFNCKWHRVSTEIPEKYTNSRENGRKNNTKTY